MDLTADVTVTVNSTVFAVAEANFVSIPGGTFQMGDIKNYNVYAPEKPVHSVTLDPFYIMEREVTVAEYKSYVDATTSCVYGGGTAINYTYNNTTPVDKTNHPINYVSWDDIQGYIAWKNANSSDPTYDLCTEAQ